MSRARRLRLTVTTAVVLLVVLAFALVRAAQPVPAPRLSRLLPATWRVPGTAPAVPWPAAGQAALTVPGIGSLGSSGGGQPVPIASVAKVMTAYVVLTDHPLAPTAAGPSISITGKDVAAYLAGVPLGESVLPVRLGERLTERQALEALLVPSANNIADALARWDAGSVAAFVAKMNRAAARLGMTHTHYAGPSGFNPATVSTATDQVRLAERAMADSTFATIVALPAVRLPLAGVVTNYNGLLGQAGVIGVKTGSTMPAGGCLVFAARRTVAGRPVTVFGAVLGQPGTNLILRALLASGPLIDAGFAALRAITVAPAGTPVARVDYAWGPAQRVRLNRPVAVLGWPGLTVRVGVRSAAPDRGALPAGTPLGALTGQLGGQRVSVVLRLPGRIPAPSWWWRVMHG